MGRRDVRDHGVGATAGDAVDLQRGLGPEPGQGREAGLADQLRHAQVGPVGVLVEGDRRDLGELASAERRGCRRRSRRPRSGSSGSWNEARSSTSAWTGLATVPPYRPECRSRSAPVTSMSSAEQALGGDRERRLVGPPHRAVGRDHQVGGERLRVGPDVRRQVRAADLLLTLEEEPHVERQRALLGQELPAGLDREVRRPLVVGGTAAAHPVLAGRRVGVAGQLERRGHPLRQVAGGLHVVVAVDQDGRRPGPVEPGADHGRVAAGLDDLGVGEVDLAPRSTPRPAASSRGRRRG